MLWTLRSSRAWSLPYRSPRRSSLFTPGPRLLRALQTNSPKPTSFREELAKALPLPSFTDAIQRPSVRRQILFTIAGTFGALVVGAHLTNYELFKWWDYLQASPQGGYDRNRPPTSDELTRVKYFVLGRQLQAALATLKTSIDQFPDTMKAMMVWSYVQVFQPILNATEGKRMCWAIGAVNCVVWLAWRIPRWGPVMMRSFTHNPLSGRSYTLFTSMFSHENFFHLLFNCMALASFGAAASQQLIVQFKRVEQERGLMAEPAPKWHLFALFISAGLFSGLVSHIGHSRWDYPRLIARLKTAISPSSPITSRLWGRWRSPSASTTTTPAAEAAASKEFVASASLGSSGAVYALFALTALGFPDAEITFVIPPYFPINIQTGFYALLAIDVLGVIRGWKFLDHFAHVGGALFGAFWYKYGAEIWYTVREWDLVAAFYLHGHGNKLRMKRDDKP